MRRDLLTYLRERIKEVLTPGSGEAIVVQLHGPELPVLRESAAKLFDALKDVPGLVNLHVGQILDIPHVEIKVDLEKAAVHGLKPGDIRRIATVVTSGQEVTDIHLNGKVYDIFVWAPKSLRQSPDSLKDFLIDTPYGGRVRLGDVASVKVVPSPNNVSRINNSRYIPVEGNVAGRDLASVAKEVEERLDKVTFPVGVTPVLLGEYKALQEAQGNLLYATIAAAIGILIILQASFRNWALSLLIYIALPAALIGGLLAAYAGGGVLSLGSLVGIITILGIAARNGILLIEHYRHLEEVEGEPFGMGLIMRGASERLSPILMTTLATGLALVPLVVAGTIPGHEIEHPMAIVILGGLVTSTLLTLFVVPLLYFRFGRGVARKRGVPSPQPVTS
jgi:Cu/Ag efflux pump CusA